VLGALALAAVAGAAAPLAAQDDVAIAVGRTPPAATVQALDGTPVELARHVGRRPVVVQFWASWCSVCESLTPRMREAQRQFGGRVDFVVIGVGVNQSRNTMRRYVERHPEPFTFYFDADGAAVRAFEVPATGVVVALDARGRVVYSGAGADQDVVGAARRAATTPR
jgi:thiol-disulfide isomerase/thioredoxin